MNRIVIVGGGAMGGVFAAAISESGRPTTIVDVSPLVLGAIEHDGLRLTTAEGERSVVVAATADPASVGPADIVLVFVKAAHTRSVAGTLGSLIGPGTVVASLQNGWGNADILAESVPPEQLVVGVTYHSATVVSPGHVRHTGRGPTFVGPYRDGDPLDAADRVAAALQAAGLDVTAAADVKREVWRKLVLNAATLPVASLSLLRAGQLGEPGPLRDLVDGLASEAVSVARALGHDIDTTERIERIHAVLAGAGDGKPSMLQDVEARRLTEIDTINGAVAKAAASVGLEAPLSAAMTALVHGLEQSWRREEGA